LLNGSAVKQDSRARSQASIRRDGQSQRHPSTTRLGRDP